MRSLLLCLSLSIILVTPAFSRSHKDRRAYKLYHSCVYYPVMIMTFLAGGIPSVIGHINDKVDSNLFQRAKAEAPVN
jgi:hypothetical protein